MASDERPRVPRVKRLRGLRDIRTIGSARAGGAQRIHSAGKTGSSPRQGPSPGSAPATRLGLRTGRLATAPRAATERPHAWVFVRRPRFARHQGMLLVEPLSEILRCEIFEEGAALVVLAELSGVSEEEVEVRVSGDILVIAAGGAPGSPRYYGEILLPFAVASQPIERALRNGVLEIGLEREHQSDYRTAADMSEET